MSPFFGISYLLNNRILLKLEHDTTATDQNIEYEIPENQYSLGVDFLAHKNFNLGISYERGNTFSLRFSYKNNPQISKKTYKYKSYETNNETDKYTKLRKNLEKNGIGVTKIIEDSSSIGLELTQFIHPNFNIIEEIIYAATSDSGIEKEVKTDIRIADLEVISEIDDSFSLNSKQSTREKRPQVLTHLLTLY